VRVKDARKKERVMRMITSLVVLILLFFSPSLSQFVRYLSLINYTIILFLSLCVNPLFRYNLSTVDPLALCNDATSAVYYFRVFI
jgi:hypothetical protein